MKALRTPVVAATAWLAMGCGAPQEDVEPAARLVFGSERVDMADGSLVPMLVGPQFGVMFMLGIRAQGVDPSQPFFTFEVVLDEQQVAYTEFAGTLRPLDDPSADWELPPIAMVLEGVYPDTLDQYDGKAALIRATLDDQDGAFLTMTVNAIATQ